jgi:hypothetical protein
MHPASSPGARGGGAVSRYYCAVLSATAGRPTSTLTASHAAGGISGEGLDRLRDEIGELIDEVAALEHASRQASPDAAARERALERIREVETRLERVMAEVRELNRQMTLIESWRH